MFHSARSHTFGVEVADHEAGGRILGTGESRRERSTEPGLGSVEVLVFGKKVLGLQLQGDFRVLHPSTGRGVQRQAVKCGD
jgi:hypothetical protein